ncbi:amino acid adenylation domain-containing protein [Streptomyces sp. NPDC089799]|uniref:amino acid adenylation domain-containing protein n=1 Tax=Streptomyces sp. NPDC089799 TaxID=3155066 RepID=UPI00342706EF
MSTHDPGALSLPLTSPQAGVWFAQQLAPGRTDYAIGEYLEIRGPLDATVFEQAIDLVLAETETLGMRFAESGGEVRQGPVARRPFRLETADLRGRADGRAEAEELMRSALARPMDLASGDVHRHLLVRSGADRHLWMHGYHHIVVDAYGGSLLARRTAEVYTALATGVPVPAPEEPAAPWAEIVAEERAYRESAEWARDRGFWQGVLAAAPDPVAFTGRPPARPAGTPLRCRGDLAAPDAHRLRAMARSLGTRWSAVVVAASAAYLHRVGGTEDVVLGLPVTGRTTPAARRTPGMFSKVLPLRLRVTGGMTVGELVRGASAAIRDALRHQRFRVEELYGDAPPWSASVNVMSLDYVLSFAGSAATAHNVAVGPVEFLSLNVYDRGGDTPLTVQAEADAADTGAAGLAAHRDRFLAFLTALADAGPDAALDSVDLLTGGDRALLAEYADGGGRGAEAGGEGALLHGVFEQQARRTPGATAVVCAGQEVTYAELDAMAGAVADRLRGRVAPGDPVGVCVHRSPAMVAALLGVLKAGGCYVPLDPGLPQARVAQMAQDAGISVAVTGPGAGDRLPEGVVTVSVGAGAVPSPGAVRPSGAVRPPGAGDTAGFATGFTAGGPELPPAAPAYLLFTSGSTGRPKGVLVPHAAAADFVLGHLACAGIPGPGAGAGERFLGFAALSFDVSVLDVFGPLAAGGTLVLATDEERLDVDRLQALLAGQRVTVADLPPALLPLLDPAPLTGLRFLSTGGEAPSGDALDRWAAPGREVWNAYGPTEAAVSVTMHRCTAPSGGRVPPIGRPMRNHRAYVVDARLRLLPPGAAGELCVAGAGLAHGYAGRPGTTAEVFTADPYGGVPGGRMYRTGDLVRWTEDGELEFLGRIDRQVKVNGHRIEPGEIEAVLAAHPAVGQAAVVVDGGSGTGAGKRLVAFVAPAPGGPAAGPAELVAHLGGSLPRYMVPQVFVPVDRLPLTPGGKVDRRALVVPAPAAGGPGREVREPGSAAERTLCALFEEVLGQQAGPDDGFFELGGDSIAALSLVSRARARGLRFTLREVFAARTPAGLASAAVQDDGPGAEAAAGGPVAETGPLPATPVMRWLLDGPGPVGRFSQSMVLALPEGIGDAALVRVLQEVLDRHPALRMRMAPGPDGRPQCELPAPGAVDAAGVLVRTADGPGGLDAAAARAVAELDPAAGVMVRAVRYDGPDGAGRLLLVVHHLAVDGVSWRILAEDLAAVWDAVAAGRPVAPAPAGTPLRAWTAYLDGLSRAPETVAELPYWRQTLAPVGAGPDAPEPAPAAGTDAVAEAATEPTPAAVATAGAEADAEAGAEPALTALAEARAEAVAEAVTEPAPAAVAEAATEPAPAAVVQAVAHAVVEAGVDARAETRAAEAAPWDRVPDPGRDLVSGNRTLRVSLPAGVAGPLLTGVPAALRTGPAEVLLAGLVLAAHAVRGRVDCAGVADSLLLDLEGHGRADASGLHDLSRTVGWFTTQYPVRLDLRGLDPAAARAGDAAALADVVERVHVALASVPGHGTGFGLLSRLNPATARELATLPAPRVLFNYLGRFDGTGTAAWGPAPEAGGLRADADPSMPVDHALQIDAMAVAGSGGTAFEAVLTWPSALVGRDEAEALGAAWEEALRLLATAAAAVPEGGPSGGDGRPAPRDVPLVRVTGRDLDGLAGRYPLLADVLPLSPLQEGLFFHAAYDADGVDAYTGQIVLTLHGPLDPGRLRASCARLLDRHAGLRAAFTDRGTGRPVQVVSGRVELPWQETDLSGLPAADREAGWQALLAGDRARRFDLERPPLVRFTLVRTGGSEHRLVVTNHHILWDGWSSAVILRELLTGYREPTDALPAAPAYREFPGWLARQDRQAAAEAWAAALDGLAEPTLLGAADPHRMAELPERITVELSEELTARLTAGARAAGITLNSVVQGLWAVLLGRLTGREDVVFGGTVSGRDAAFEGVGELVGLLINTLPVRFRVRRDEGLGAALVRFQHEQAGLLDHRHASLAQVQGAAGLGTLFDTAVVVENYPLDLEGMRDLAGEVRLAGVDACDATHYTANLVVLPGDRLRLHLDHRPDALDARAALSVAEGLERLLTAFAEDPELPAGAVDLLSDGQHRLVEEWNATAVPVPETTLSALFEAQAARTPHALATVSGSERLDYAELDARAEALARVLRAHGARPETVVAVALHRSTEMVVALLAVLKSGAAYLPVDPSLPEGRVAYLLEDARPVLLIATDGVAAVLPAVTDGPLRVRPDGTTDRDAQTDPGTDAGTDAGTDGLPDAGGALPSHPAYVIYTSGSTGRPKAVVVEHAAIVNRLLWMQDRYRLAADDRVLQKTPFGFDVSVWEFFWPLLAGAAIVVAAPGGHKDPAYLARLIRQESVTTVHFVPSMLAEFVREPAAAECRSLRRVVCSGEALGEAVKNRFLDLLDVPLHNLYGPTEAAVDVTHWDCLRADTGPVPIGRPIRNTALHVLDAAGRQVPLGFPGELYLAGAGLARGYLGRPGLTAERFPASPYGPPGSRMYRTGDIARRRADGAVEYLGRTDDQVKIHGFRIELGEIEATLSRTSGAARAAVVVREDRPGEKRLVGYVVPEPGADAPVPEAVRAELARTLPEYMVPAVVLVDALPVTANGKLDRAALPAPDDPAGAAGSPGGTGEPPEGETEELVAAVWRSVLGVDRVGRHDDFFALGGHSLSATRVAARLRQSLLLELPLHTLFEHRTVAGLAGAVEAALLAELADGPDPADPYPDPVTDPAAGPDPYPAADPYGSAESDALLVPAAPAPGDDALAPQGDRS